MVRASAESLQEATRSLMNLQKKAGLGSTDSPRSQLSEMEYFSETGNFEFAVVDDKVIINRVQAWVLAGYQRLKELQVKANWGKRKFTKQGKKFALVISDDL